MATKCHANSPAKARFIKAKCKAKVLDDKAEAKNVDLKATAKARLSNIYCLLKIHASTQIH